MGCPRRPSAPSTATPGWRLAGWIRRKHHLTSRKPAPTPVLRPGLADRPQRGRVHRRLQRRRDPLPLPRSEHPDPLDPHRHERLSNGQDTWRAGCGERHARPVRRADTGNGPGATRAPRPCPTQLPTYPPLTCTVGRPGVPQRRGQAAAHPAPPAPTTMVASCRCRWRRSCPGRA